MSSSVPPATALARDRTRDRGRWILTDAHLRLLSIGPRLYPGTSMRTGMDYVARRSLVPQLHSALATGKAATDVTTVDDRRWTVRAIPVRGAFSGLPVAVLGCYDEVGIQLPDPPLVGSWEWVQPPPGPGQWPRTYWSPEHYGVFGVAIRQPDWWEGPEWLDELVAVADRPAVRAQWTSLIADDVPVLRICTFTATPPTGERYLLRGAGRRYEENGQVFLRGVTARLHDQTVEPQHGLLEAVLDLARDPMCLIDPQDEVIYLTSNGFPRLGLKLPTTRHLPELCHEEDLPALRALLTRTSTELGHRHGPIIGRFAAAAGGWTRLEVYGTAVHVTPQSVHVLCRLTSFDHG